MKALNEQRKAGELPAEVARVYDDLKKLGYAPDAANTNIGSAIFANKPGDGSAREQAASCQRVLGGAANFACEYATKRYRSNCINWGMLPFLVENPGALDNGDYVYLPGVRKALLEAADELDAVARQTRAWAERGDVFAYFISGAKVRNPAAAQALIAKLK